MLTLKRKSTSLWRLMPIAAGLAVSLAMPEPTPAITWCHDYVYSVISQGQDSNNLSAEALRYQLWRRGYLPVNGTVLLREPMVGSSPLVGSTLFTLTGQATDSNNLREGDVLIFGDAHSGVVVTEHGLLNHFLQDSKEQGRPYTIYAAMHALDSALPNTSLLRRRATLQSIRDTTHAPVDGGPPIQPYKNIPVQVWRPNDAQLMTDWANGPISYSTGTAPAQIGSRRESRFGSPVPGTFEVYGPGLDAEYALVYMKFNFSAGRGVWLFMATNKANPSLRYVIFQDPDNGEWRGWYQAYDLHLYW